MYDAKCDDARGEIVKIIVGRGGEGLHSERCFTELGYYPKLGAHQHEILIHQYEILVHQHENLAYYK